MTTSILVLGGTHHVGRAVVEEALARGHAVTTLNRGQSGTAVAGRRGAPRRPHRRRRPGRGARGRHLGRRRRHLVVRTPGGADLGAAAVAGGRRTTPTSRRARSTPGRSRTGSTSRHRWSTARPEPRPPTTPPTSGAASWRRCEFDGDVLLARAGLILGPYERVGRMPWWFRRISAGGRVPAPGPYDRPLQYIDARDLAAFALDRPVGTFDTVSRPGHTTIGLLLDEAVRVSGADAELVWLSPETIERAEVSGWTELPIWVPPTGELAACTTANVEAAYDAGLRCRPMPETVARHLGLAAGRGLPEGLVARRHRAGRRRGGAAVGRGGRPQRPTARPTRWGEPSFGLVRAKARPSGVAAVPNATVPGSSTGFLNATSTRTASGSRFSTAARQPRHAPHPVGDLAREAERLRGEPVAGGSGCGRPRPRRTAGPGRPAAATRRCRRDVRERRRLACRRPVVGRSRGASNVEVSSHTGSPRACTEVSEVEDPPLRVRAEPADRTVTWSVSSRPAGRCWVSEFSRCTVPMAGNGNEPSVMIARCRGKASRCG